MIRYALNCAKGHSFESWFQSADAFDALAERGMLSCAVCGGAEVSKAIMAPKVAKGGVAKGEAEAPPAGPLSAPASPAEQALAEIRRKVEENSDYVGDSFASEVRAIQDGEAPDRPIWGEARLPEAKALIEEGAPVAPLPFMPPRKVN